MELKVGPGVAEHVQARGGRLWIWLDPHPGLGGVTTTFLLCATERPGATKTTRRLRSARRPHRFTTHEAPGIDVSFDAGWMDPPEELHLELKRFPRTRVEAYWNGAIFAGEDVPPPSPG
jgi:hypothetical protein